MNQHQQKQVAMIQAHLSIGNIESAAMGLSALVRSAMTNKQKQALLQVAEELKLKSHASFII
jgi:hypothetical protein